MAALTSNRTARIAFGGFVVAAALVVMWMTYTGWGAAHRGWQQLAQSGLLVLLGIQQLASESFIPRAWRLSLAAFVFAVAAFGVVMFFVKG